MRVKDAERPMELRNIAIIAHVDHGKTTLVDCLLRQSGTFRDNQYVPDQALDAGELERERGITILAKCTSVEWGEARINIVDTPGHADFGGEVERILSMVDGCLLLVDAAEGPMPQTKFVLTKVLELGLKPIVVINKVDRPDARPDQVLDEVFDLFALLDASADQLDFPVLYASAKEGWAAADPDSGERNDMAALFDLVLGHVPAPEADTDGPFRMLATTLEGNPYLGRLLTGRIAAGVVRPNMTVKALARDGTVIEHGRITKVLAFRGLERAPLDEARAGDIVALAGLGKATVADTLCDPSVDDAIAARPIDPSTLAITFSINDSPLGGTEGDKVTSRVLWDRLRREAEGNVAIRVSETEGATAFEVAGRGELQLAVLIETMRREGYEMSISRPRVLFRTGAGGRREEPIEEVVIDVDEAFSGAVVEKLGRRRGELIGMRPSGGGKQRLVFHAPSRALIGYHGEFMTDTRGTGVMHRVFHAYGPDRGPIAMRHNGVMVSVSQGQAVPYALWNLEERGPMFIGPGEKVYRGMIIGECSRGHDIDVNPLKTKQLTNIRASGSDEAVTLTPPARMTLERAIAYIADDELVEITPHSIRLRKRHLDPVARKRAARQHAASA